MVGQFFFGGGMYVEKVFFLYLLDDPNTMAFFLLNGGMPVTLCRRIRTISNGSDLCIPSGVGGAQLPMKP